MPNGLEQTPAVDDKGRARDEVCAGEEDDRFGHVLG
jgi:hypothetical protein